VGMKVNNGMGDPLYIMILNIVPVCRIYWLSLLHEQKRMAKFVDLFPILPGVYSKNMHMVLFFIMEHDLEKAVNMKLILCIF
jgi:hypothetical protein